MKFVDEFRDAATLQNLIDAIRARVTRPWTIMEVCGGQTHGLLRYGLVEALVGCVELLHGPGCPVCVTSVAIIDRAIELSRRPGVLLATFGDMLRVPGSRASLASAKAEGAQVRTVYSPLDAVAIAAQNRETLVVFLAVGFETTAPATALAVRIAARQGLANFQVLSAHVRVQPAMERLLAATDNRVQGFLAAGHVCTVVGYQSYEALCRRYRVPVVVTGFEPLDLATGILACVTQLEQGQHTIENQYARSVQACGNTHAAALIDDVYEVCDRDWRGLGVVNGGGLRLRAAWRAFDAETTSAAEYSPSDGAQRCQAGAVLAGRLKPCDCPEFGRSCTPEQPLGAPMVSSEGACAAYFHYRPTTVLASRT